MADADFSASGPVGTLAIHGVGLIGGSLGMAALGRCLARDVVGIGRDRSRLEAAARLGAISRYAVADSPDKVADACSDADLIVLCTPVSNIVADLPAILSRARSSAVVTDVGSVKQAIVDASSGDPRFVGSHPMAGSELAGIYAAKSTLFEEAVWALTPTKATGTQALGLVRSLAHGVGATTRILDASRHDEAVAVTSHLPHVLAYALMSLAAQRSSENEDLVFLGAGSFAGATRVAASAPGLWADIARANRSALRQALVDYRATLSLVIDAMDCEDWAKLEMLFARGYEAKRRWPGR